MNMTIRSMGNSLSTPGRLSLAAVAIAGLLLFFLPRADPVYAAGFSVNSTLDERDATLDGDCYSTPSGKCTLRAALQEANHSTGVADTISLPPGVYILTKEGANEDNAVTGDLDITHNSGGVSIHGSYSGKVIIDGNDIDRVLDICCQTNSVYIEAVTIRNGRVGGTRHGFYDHGHGAGIHNHGDLTLKNVAIVDNVVNNSRTTESWGGGGLTNGCGISPSFPESYSACELHSRGKATLTNVTVANNAVIGGAKGGGGIENGGELVATNVTIYNNVAPSTKGGGISNNTTVGGFVELRNTIVANNTGEDCTAGIQSGGYNLASDGTCDFNQRSDRNNTDPRLFLFDGYWESSLGTVVWGGPTVVYGLGRSSPAIDAGNPLYYCPGTDQRGDDRPKDGTGNGTVTCDIGAYELQTPYGPAIDHLTPSQATAGSPGFTLTVDGTSFLSGSTVLWDGHPRSTTYLSTTRLTAAILAADVQTPGSVYVRVQHPPPSNRTSSDTYYSIAAPTPTPTSTPTPTPIPSATATEIPSASATPPAATTATSTATDAATPTPSATATSPPEASPSATATPGDGATPIATATPTTTSTPSSTIDASTEPRAYLPIVGRDSSAAAALTAHSAVRPMGRMAEW